MLHFAYGSNMSREPMRRRCPGARMLGRATLCKHRFVIMANGYASVVPAPSGDVHGVLWRITPHDLAALDAYENVAGGLYRRVMLPVTHKAATVTAMTYLGCDKREGHPRKGYLELVVESAREAGLPAEYIEGLARYSGGAVPFERVLRHRRQDMSEHVIRRVIIRGRVQGVGYRDWTRYVARERGVEGWVRNRKDGSVEAVFSGTPDAVSGMIAACRKGPSNARVEWVEQHDALAGDLDARRPGQPFSVIATL